MTFIAYPNLQAESEDGVFRVEVVGQPEEDFFRDQGSFVYRSFRSGQLVWEWDPAKAEQLRAGVDSEGGWNGLLAMFAAKAAAS